MALWSPVELSEAHLNLVEPSGPQENLMVPSTDVFSDLFSGLFFSSFF